MERAEIGLWFDLDTGNVASAISDSRAYTFSGQFLAVSLLTSLGPYSALKGIGLPEGFLRFHTEKTIKHDRQNGSSDTEKSLGARR